MITAILRTNAEQSSLLRRSLLADVVVSGSAGLLLTLAAGPLGDLFDLPVSLLRVAGISFLPYAAFVAYVATRAEIPRPGAWAVVGANLTWAAVSLLALVAGWVDPSGIGVAFVDCTGGSRQRLCRVAIRRPASRGVSAPASVTPSLVTMAASPALCDPRR